MVGVGVKGNVRTVHRASIIRIASRMPRCDFHRHSQPEADEGLHAPRLLTTSIPLADGRLIQVRKAGIPDAEQPLVNKSLGIDWENAFPPRKSVIND